MTSEQVLRTGVLFKKGSGNGPFGRRNWKPRYFVLTPRKLMYYTYEDGELKGEVDLSSCNEQSIEVMPADSMKTGSSASTIWRIAINTADRRLLVAAGTELEMNDWVEQFLVAFSMNSGQPLPVRASMHQAHAIAPGAIANTEVSRNTITDFQNFAVARKSVSGAIRASMGAHGGHEFRLSDEHERQKQAEQQRQVDERHQQELKEERMRQEELLQAHLRSQEEERRKEHEAQEAERRAEEERVRHELLLEEQRRLKRERHERERQEAERQLRELELEEQEKRHEVEIRRHFDETPAPEVEIVRRHVETPVQVTHHHERRSYHQEMRVVSSPSSSPARSPVDANGLSSPAAVASPAPRSSLIGDAKKEAMERQQAEHTRRREAVIKEQQEQMRKEFLQQDAELHARAPPPPVMPQSPAKRDESDAYRAMSSVEF